MPTTPITIQQIVDYAQNAFPDIQDGTSWNQRALCYNPERQLPQGVCFLTFKEKEGTNGSASKIAHGQYQLNVGISKRTFTQLFGSIPARPVAGGPVDPGRDFALTDVMTPHPVYGWLFWIAIKNPSEATFNRLKPLLGEAYRLAISKFRARTAGN